MVFLFSLLLLALEQLVYRAVYTLQIFLGAIFQSAGHVKLQRRHLKV
jgi:hypothetical protein